MTNTAPAPFTASDVVVVREFRDAAGKVVAGVFRVGAWECNVLTAEEALEMANRHELAKREKDAAVVELTPAQQIEKARLAVHLAEKNLKAQEAYSRNTTAQKAARTRLYNAKDRFAFLQAVAEVPDVAHGLTFEDYRKAFEAGYSAWRNLDDLDARLDRYAARRPSAAQVQAFLDGNTWGDYGVGDALLAKVAERR